MLSHNLATCPFDSLWREPDMKCDVIASCSSVLLTYQNRVKRTLWGGVIERDSNKINYI